MFHKTTIAFSLLGLLTFAPLFSADETAERLLKDGWSEYHFTVFDSADSLFRKAEHAAGATPEQIAEALMGRAFCIQFGGLANISIGDYRKAVSYYDKALKTVGKENRLSPFIMELSAECNYLAYKIGAGKEYLRKAQETWNEIKTSYPASIPAQEEILFKTAYAVTSDNLPDDSALKAVADMEDFVSENLNKNDAGTASAGNPLLLAPMCSYLAEFYIARGDFAKGAQWLENYLKIGATNHINDAKSMFKLARIYEIELKDKSKAADAYEKFYTKFPNDLKTFFSQEREKILRGKERME